MTRWLERRLILDRVLAVPLLVATAPFVVFAGVVLAGSGIGWPIVRVDRIGRHGVAFRMLKLRTMRDPAGSAVAAPSDSRTSSVGRLVRASHVDELPQLFHVVAGTMSLLGPRPEAPEFVDRTDESWASILSVPPGLAGVTQFLLARFEHEVLNDAVRNGLGGEALNDVYRHHVLPEKVAVDAWYTKNASPRVDLVTILSILAGLLGRRDTPNSRRLRRWAGVDLQEVLRS
ncbi:MAG: sugar transferase [Acidimicrobiales bacterium]